MCKIRETVQIILFVISTDSSLAFTRPILIKNSESICGATEGVPKPEVRFHCGEIHKLIVNSLSNC